MKTLPLSQGKFADVPLDLLPRLRKYKWYARKRGNTWIAVRNKKGCNGKETSVMLHRVIMEMRGHKLKARHVDQRNGNGLDGRDANLIFVTRSQTGQGRRRGINNTSGYKGVSRSYGKWVARIGINGKRILLGVYRSKIQAALAYDAFARAQWGRFAALNFPRCGEAAA